MILVQGPSACGALVLEQGFKGSAKPPQVRKNTVCLYFEMFYCKQPDFSCYYMAVSAYLVIGLKFTAGKRYENDGGIALL